MIENDYMDRTWLKGLFMYQFNYGVFIFAEYLENFYIS